MINIFRKPTERVLSPINLHYEFKKALVEFNKAEVAYEKKQNDKNAARYEETRQRLCTLRSMKRNLEVA